MAGMRKPLQFVAAAGGWGGASVIAGFASLVIGFIEYLRGESLPGYAFTCVAMILICWGAHPVSKG